MSRHAEQEAGTRQVDSQPIRSSAHFQRTCGLANWRNRGLYNELPVPAPMCPTPDHNSPALPRDRTSCNGCYARSNQGSKHACSRHSPGL